MSDQENVYQGLDPALTPSHDRELFAWADETSRRNVSTLNDSLRQLVALSTALLAGSAALVDKMPAERGFKGLSAMLLMLCLGLSLFGSIPRTAYIDTNNSAAIEDERDRGLKFKKGFLCAAAMCLFLAFAFLLIGVFLAPA